MQNSFTIQKQPLLDDSSNYELLRQKGLEYIQQLGSNSWTDYNIHDPGITILELLAYAITDLGYRTSLDIKDLLAVPFNEIPDNNRQAFYTAREILTTNPWTNRDYRKLLIDIDGVKNAWLNCKKCACDDIYVYANCAKSILQYTPTEHKIIIRGLYDVLLEFEDAEGAGNLNSGKTRYNFSFLHNGGFKTAAIEIRLPSWQMIDSKEVVQKHLENDMVRYEKLLQLINSSSAIDSVAIDFISGTKDDDADIPANELGSRLRKPVYVTFSVNYIPGADLGSPLLPASIKFADVPMTLWFNSDAERKAVTLADIKDALSDASKSGIINKYVGKLRTAAGIIKKANLQLHSHRNLSEDYCTVRAVETEDIGVCADIEVAPAMDIEAIMAEAYFQIDQYFSPDIKFYSLNQLLAEGKQVDEIFDGPKLNNEFIKNEQLDSTNLRRVLYTSDIINLLMDIPGVIAVKNFVLTRYNDEGFLVESQPWSMEVSALHQPRLYVEATKFLVFKNGLPFLADKLELADSLQVIIGNNAQPKIPATENDLQVPTGTYYDLDEYYPVQYSLPLTYGTGHEGLPSTATMQRKSQALQLKAYLLFYEQLLVNYIEQLKHIKDLFALDPSVEHSYFSRLLGKEEIKVVDTIYDSLSEEIVQRLEESPQEFLDRRNRFLDHMLARFAEQFTDYALMLYSYAESKDVAAGKLIKDKIAFLKDYPFMSYNKARSFNYKPADSASVCSPENVAGLTVRIRRLLGIAEYASYFELFDEVDSNGVVLNRRWRLVSRDGKIYLVSTSVFNDPSIAVAEQLARAEYAVVRKLITVAANFSVTPGVQWQLQLHDEASAVIATHPDGFTGQPEGQAMRDEIITFVKTILEEEKLFIVEHLLLRPRNLPGAIVPAGDSLLPICIGPDCDVCGEEDPYSFRLTVVMNGEKGIANRGIEFRRFAERTIRMEVPAHLALKVCWVSRRQLEVFEKIYCDWLKEQSKEKPDPVILSNKLHRLICIFSKLKNVYPPASLHDCVDGNDENRVYLNQTII
jgi:hypothetical protein